MSALGDALSTKNREAVLGSTITISVDSLTDAATPTYSIKLEAPSYSEVVLTGQTDVGLAAALTEFTDWAAATWTE